MPVLKFLSLIFISILFLFVIIFVIIAPVKAVTLAEQTQEYSASLNVWQSIQELGTDLEGPLKSFTFRVHTTLPRNQQFDFTAGNSEIHDKTTNTEVVDFGCRPQGGDPNDRLRGLTFTTEGVPEGFEDVTIDFSCHNFSFIKGHRYLIRLSNANMAAFGGMRMQLASAAYGNSGQDFFPGGGLRYAFDNKSCNPLTYVWNSQTANAGCNVFTTPKDDLYFIISDTTPEPTPTPSPTPTPTPTPAPAKTPLILIPGIGGSELKVVEDTIWNQDNGHGGEFSHIYPAEEKVWVNEEEAAKPGDDDYFDVLSMRDDGITSEANIGLTNNLVPQSYQPMIDFFTSNGYVLNQDLFIFPYDWRLDISGTATLTDQKIQQIKQQTGSQKIDIVSHSMGGLVSRYYIADSAKAQNVRKLFTLGTPHLGAVESLKNIIYGGCLTKLPLLAQFICLGIPPSEIKDVLQNLVSGFELAPSQSYFNFYPGEDNQHPYPYRNESGALNYTQIKNLLTSLNHNTALFTPSETFHSIDSALSNTNGVDITIIAGSGQSTLGQIIEEKTTSLLGIQSVHKDAIAINGDDTVPLYSASLNDPDKNQSLLGPAKVYYTKQKHGDLVTSGPALNLVKNILEGSNELPAGVSDQQYKLRGFSLSVHSPVNIHVYDTSGNHTGPTEDGHFETNIPGSSYDTLDDAKFVYLPEDGVYTVNFEATDQGSFDFKVRKFEDDENTETILYKEIPLTNTAIAETVFDTQSSQIPIIDIDENGDGNIDLNINHFSILEGDANYDHNPPNISFDVNPKTIWPPNGKTVDINITGNIIDENPYLTTILVEDEYNLVEPSITTYYRTEYNQTVKLEAGRSKKDKNGRIYIIRVLVTDLAGNTSQEIFEVIVPHDQRNKK